MVYRCFNKKAASNINKGRGLSYDVISENKEFAKELHKPIIRNLKNEKYIHLLQTIFEVLVILDMQLLSKFDKGIRFLLCITDIFSKYALQLLMLFRKS